MGADRVIPMTYGSQGHEITSNTRIDQSVNHKGNEVPTPIPPQFKDINVGRYITIVHLCAEVPHELP